MLPLRPYYRTKLSGACLRFTRLRFCNPLLRELCFSLDDLQRVPVIAEAPLERADGFYDALHVFVG